MASVWEELRIHAIFIRCKIECMKQTRPVLAASLAALSLAPRAMHSAMTCVEMPPLKPLHRVCGVVFLSDGERTPNATVSVLHEDKKIAVQKTDDNGNFAFDHLKPGKYELRFLVADVPGMASTKVVLASPNPKSTQEIAVGINIQLANCSSFSLVETKPFEATLKPTDDQ
jgi:hypothetical protein